ncbi:helix-turn-helix domain-containing protein [Streptomyces sp. G45]|uniref:helix-turn-helix domain-containing protein n=1 Tax=Streptomyces sp. G45 TaxID=3406627 RepID=UPI003C192590
MWPPLVGHVGHIGEDGVGQRPNELTPHKSPQHYLGAEMRAWRTQRKLSLAKLKALIRYDYSYMGRVERGEQAPSAALVRAYDDALGASGALVRLHEMILSGAGMDVLSRTHVAKAGSHVANGSVDLADNPDVHALSDAEGISVPAGPLTEGSSSCLYLEGRFWEAWVPRLRASWALRWHRPVRRRPRGWWRRTATRSSTCRRSAGCSSTRTTCSARTS